MSDFNFFHDPDEAMRKAQAAYRKAHPEKVLRWRYSSFRAFCEQYEREYPDEARAICERKGWKL